MPTSSQWLTIHSPDGPFQAYLALPHGGRGGPGIVLLQEIFGVNEHIRSVADQYAADGYVVLAPDLFWRQGPRIELGYDDADWKRAVALMNACDVALARADIALAAAALRARPGVGANIAALGFCFGGRLSFLAACDGVVDAAVAYYGGGIQNYLEQAARLAVPLQLHFGAEDDHIPAAAVRSIAERFAANEDVEIHLYPQAAHGFNCDHRAGYQQRAAAQAHGNSLLFLAERL